jgi:hypothetical protein
MDTSLVDLTPPKIDWEFLRNRMEECPWSPPARAAGLWAIDVLREELGPLWPRAWRRSESAPPELLASGHSLAAYIGTLDLALALRRIRDMPGARALRDAIAGTVRYDALMSPRLQMRIASVALGAAVGVGIEPLMPDAEAPADLLLSRAGVSCAVELLAVMRDAKTLDADRWLETVTFELLRIGQLHKVDFRGRVQEPLDEQLTSELLQEVERRAGATAKGLELPEVQCGGVAVTTLPATGEGGGTSFDLPMISYGQRIADKLGDKADQMRRSRADWVLVDWMDHLWHMTAWGARPLAEKASDLAALVREQLHAEPHIQGVVITDGAVLMRGDVPEQTVELSEGAIAIGRQIDKWHTRESVVIPLQPLALEAAHLWLDILDAEHHWLIRELKAVGLEPPVELIAM